MTQVRRELVGGVYKISRPSSKRKPKRMRKAVTLVVILLLGTGGGLVVARAARPLPGATVALSVNDIDGETVTLPWTASGKSAIALADGPILAAGPQADTLTPTASIAKLITVLTVLQKKPLEENQPGPTITLTDQDVALRADYQARGGSTVYVEQGEQLSERQVIEAMLLPSANNMADTLAIWAFGSLDEYRAAAQKYVGGLGMTKTTIGSDASGLSPNTTSTARDLIRLGQAAYKVPVVRQITAQQSTDIPLTGTIYTTNLVLGDSGITGLKTGTSNEAGDCFLFSASHAFPGGDPTGFIGVVMDAGTGDQRFSDATALLDAAYDGFVQRKVALKGQAVGTVTTAWGASSPVVTKADLTTFTWRADAVKVTTETGHQSATVPAGTTVGDIKANGSSAPLVTKNELTAPDLWWRITH